MSLTDERHGHVTPRLDSVKMRCGGPRFCQVCAREVASIEAEATRPQEPVAIYHGVMDCGEFGAFNLEILKMIPRGANLYTTPQPCQSCAEKQSAIDVWEGRYADLSAKCAELEAEVLSKEGMALVTKEDAENYCRILSLLGMEEEGSPVEEVKRLISLHEGMTCGDCNDTGWLENREEGRYPCTCMTEAEPYQILQAKCAKLESNLEQLEADFNAQEVRTHSIRQERDALTMQNKQFRKLLDGMAHEVAFYGDQPPQDVLDAIALPDLSTEIIKRHDAAVLFNAAKNLRLSEGSVTPFYNSMRTAIEQVEIMAHELDKS